ncbi:hypothetical protein D3C77_460500 [compost metagenome]
MNNKVPKLLNQHKLNSAVLTFLHFMVTKVCGALAKCAELQKRCSTAVAAWVVIVA